MFSRRETINVGIDFELGRLLMTKPEPKKEKQLLEKSQKSWNDAWSYLSFFGLSRD